MFEDFGQEQTAIEGRGRRGVSAVLSLAIFGGIAVVLGGALTAHHVHARRKEGELDVTFADLPSLKAPKPRPLVAAKGVAKKAAPRNKPLAAVKEIPEERPQEADGELAVTDDTGAVGGVLEEKPVVAAAALPPPPPPRVEAPPAPPDDQQRETIVAPRFLSGCSAPEVPEALQTSAATIHIDVRMLIGARGEVLSAKVVQSHPLVPDELVLACARAQTFKPAHLPDGTAVPFPYLRRFVFRPAQA